MAELGLVVLHEVVVLLLDALDTGARCRMRRLAHRLEDLLEVGDVSLRLLQVGRDYAEKTLTKVLPKLADEASDRGLSRYHVPPEGDGGSRR